MSGAHQRIAHRHRCALVHRVGANSGRALRAAPAGQAAIHLIRDSRGDARNPASARPARASSASMSATSSLRVGHPSKIPAARCGRPPSIWSRPWTVPRPTPRSCCTCSAATATGPPTRLPALPESQRPRLSPRSRRPQRPHLCLAQPAHQRRHRRSHPTDHVVTRPTRRPHFGLAAPSRSGRALATCGAKRHLWANKSPAELTSAQGVEVADFIEALDADWPLLEVGSGAGS